MSLDYPAILDSVGLLLKRGQTWLLVKLHLPSYSAKIMGELDADPLFVVGLRSM